ncbi:MAG: lipoprotein [Thermodesulfovibrionales bacterium]
MRTLIIAFAAALALAACATEVRYSPSELKMFPPDIQEHIRQGEVALGMSQTAVRYAWGAPNDIIVLEPDARGNLREEWVYRDLGPLKTRLIFTGGQLSGIISSNPSISGAGRPEGGKPAARTQEPEAVEDNLAR